MTAVKIHGCVGERYGFRCLSRGRPSLHQMKECDGGKVYLSKGGWDVENYFSTKSTTACEAEQIAEEVFAQALLDPSNTARAIATTKLNGLLQCVSSLSGARVDDDTPEMVSPSQQIDHNLRGSSQVQPSPEASLQGVKQRAVTDGDFVFVPSSARGSSSPDHDDEP